MVLIIGTRKQKRAAFFLADSGVWTGTDSLVMTSSAKAFNAAFSRVDDGNMINYQESDCLHAGGDGRMEALSSQDKMLFIANLPCLEGTVSALRGWGAPDDE